MSFNKIGLVFVGSAAVLVGGAQGAISAIADISTSQTTAPYNYTINLHNNGDTNIGTFWFAWTLTPHEYDFLPTSPTNISAPTGWIFPVSHNAIPGDVYGIEFYNISGSNIAPGGSATFQFTSPDSPATLSGAAWFPGFNVTHSVVYIGFPESDPGYGFDVRVVPAPGALALSGLAALGLRRRRR